MGNWKQFCYDFFPYMYLPHTPFIFRNFTLFLTNFYKEPTLCINIWWQVFEGVGMEHSGKENAQSITTLFLRLFLIENYLRVKRRQKPESRKSSANFTLADEFRDWFLKSSLICTQRWIWSILRTHPCIQCPVSPPLPMVGLAKTWVISAMKIIL